jgi:hypothetical protein
MINCDDPFWLTGQAVKHKTFLYLENVRLEKSTELLK